MIRTRIFFAGAAVAALFNVSPVGAQQPAPTPTSQQQDTARPKSTREIVLDKLRARSNSEIRDTTAVDSLTERAGAVTATTPVRNTQPAAPAMDFPSDSVTLELMKLKDLEATQYRGAEAVFYADSNSLVLLGQTEQKAGVVRDGQTMTADSMLTFDQETSIACGYGKPVLSGGQADNPVESQEVCYDTRNRIGVAKGARTQVSEGANWFVNGDLYYKGGNLYGHDGSFTDCNLPYPHYHFAAKDVKVVNKNVMVARNVTLNFGDVPVFWLPFMMQSLKSGRRTGVLMPRFSINDIVRRNSNYNRRIYNVGFYWAMSDYMGSEVAMDWWSNNYTAVEGSLDYNFNNHFINGGATVKRFWRSGGQREFTLAAQNSWAPDERTRLSVDAQYASSTELVRQNSYDNNELRRQIASTASMSRRFGWGSVSLQTSRNQYLSDNKIDWVLPSVGVSFSTLTLFPAAGDASFYNNATWTSSAQLRRERRDFAGTDFDPSGLSGNVNSSFSMGKLSWSQSFSSDTKRGAVRRPGGEPSDSILAASQTLRISSGLSFTQRLIGTSTFSPSITFGQDMQRADTIGSNTLVKGPTRLNASAGLRMDLFGFWPGVGPISRFRHRLSPSITWGYSPAGTLFDSTSLRGRVFGRSATRESNTISIGLNQTIEGKYKEDAKREGADSAAVDSANIDPTKPRRLPQARKVTILSLNTDALMYDFVAARDSLGHGLTNTQIGNTINSDLLRGLQLSITHDLFEKQYGVREDSSTFDTGKRKFAPHLSRISASFSMSNNAWLFKFLGLGRKTDAPPATGSQETPVGTDTQGGVRPTNAVRPEYGVIGNRAAESSTSQRGPIGAWNASFNLTLDRPRDAVAAPGFSTSNSMVITNLSFQPTQNWNVSWATGYSFTTKDFTDHQLRFTRQLHDWDANFDFVKSQNGNFTFLFNVMLRANSDIKFDYTQRSRINRPNR